jgi:L-ascorbate metabolism protein UlaG (beta-lactamase superfamily)
VTGDTDLMADMDWMGELHNPDIGILCCGGHYTMDMARAAYAAKRYFNFKTVIPCHYKTFGLLAQSAEPLVAALPGTKVLTPGVMESVSL